MLTLTETDVDMSAGARNLGGDGSRTWAVEGGKILPRSLVVRSSKRVVLGGLERIHMHAKVFSASEHLDQNTVEASWSGRPKPRLL